MTKSKGSNVFSSIQTEMPVHHTQDKAFFLKENVLLFFLFLHKNIINVKKLAFGNKEHTTD